jgi:beta-phosphoglucomutase-like phosphatase (HAD superfamily)
VDRVSTEDWMRALAAHLDRMRAAYPEDELCLVFDIDGTIVDTRHLVVHVLLGYDRRHGTTHFHGITADDVIAHETRIDEILEPFALPARVRASVRAWYVEHARDPEAIAAAHRPYQGVLGVIRWFQLQPRTHVALNTGRPESMRELTLTSLNALGRLHRVRFAPELLLMHDGRGPIEDGKVAALRRLGDAGHRVVAVVDNEPANIVAMSAADEHDEVLFLHADTIFASQRLPMPRALSGSGYALSGLVDEAELGRRVTFVWHGVNETQNLRQFISSNVRWAEVDVRRDPLGRLVLRHDSFVQTPWRRDESPLLLTDLLETLRWVGDRAAKLDLKEGGDVVDEVLDLSRRFGFVDDELWFNASIETLGERGFARIRDDRPGSIRSCPVDFLVPLLLGAPQAAEGVLELLARWGATRASLDWSTPGVRDALDLVEAMGWDANLYGVPDLESFLEAALLLPASVTADFNFPEWHYYGRGAGRDGAFHRYEPADPSSERAPALR